MLDKLNKIAVFLCLVQDGQLNIPDVAFMVILGKILFATQVDWAALCAFGATVLNAMHSRQTVSTEDITRMTKRIEELQNAVSQIKAAV